jgi:hypothetical protein
LAITNTGGFAAKSDAKALALSPPKMKTAWAINAEHSGDLGVATKEPRKGRPAATGRELLRLVKRNYSRGLSLVDYQLY